MRALLIAEKPSLKRDIEDVYKKISFPDDIAFFALRGHILELQEPDGYDTSWGKPWKTEVLPMIPDKFVYKPKKDCKTLYKEVKDEMNSGKYDYIINACDAGREGELIFFEIYKTIGCKVPVKRFWASNTTEAGITKALTNLIDDKEKSLRCLKASAQYRAYFDWLMGLNLTRAFSLKTKSLTPLGRVMTPTLAMVVARELEIRNFVPKDYWEIEGDFGKYSGLWYDKESEETKITEKEKADKIINDLKSCKTAKVDKIVKEQEKKYAPTLHSLLELQREANRVFGYTSSKTLEIAQVLYEEKKIISYPRTESRYLPTDMIKDIPKHLRSLEGISEVGDIAKSILANPKKMNDVLSTKKYVDDQKLTDHHAIVPTDKVPDVSSLTKEQANIYMLVVKRFLSIFLDPYVVDKTTIITKAGEELFRTIGRVIVDKGYMALYKEEKNKEVTLPTKVKEGEELPVVGFKINTKQTAPPRRYDDSSLLQAMQNAGKFIDDEELKMVLKESAGLGTSATRAEILKKLITREMVELKGKLYYATDRGIQIITALKGKDIVSPELTARWEMKLREIEEQKYDIKAFHVEMIEYIKEVTKDFMDSVNTNINNSRTVLGKCPICGKDVIEGKAYYLCTDYKNPCTFIIGKEIGGTKITLTEAKKLVNGEQTKEMEFTWKSGRKDKATLQVKDGKVVPVFANNKTSDNNSSDTNTTEETATEFQTIGKCPKCGGDVIDAKKFFLCKAYQKGCDFALKKVIKGGNISVENAKLFLEGKTTQDIDFVWSSGETGKAKLKWGDGKLEWIFPTR